MSQQSTSPPQPGSDPRPSLRARLLALVVRPTAPPVWLGIVVAVAFIAAETLLVYRLRQIAPENAFGALFLLGVLVVSAGWGFRLAVATSLASALVYVYFHLETNGDVCPHAPPGLGRDPDLSAGRAVGQRSRRAGPPARGGVRTAPPRSRSRPCRGECARRTAGCAAASGDAGGARRRSVRGVSGRGGRTVSRAWHRQRGAVALRGRPSTGAAGNPRRPGFNETGYRRAAFARR